MILVAGIYFYRNHQATAREEALAQAMRVEDSQVSNNPVPPNITFKTVEEKDQAWNKAFTDLATKYRGSREGAIGGIFLASKAADKGNLPGSGEAVQGRRGFRAVRLCLHGVIIFGQRLRSGRKTG